MSAVIAPSDSRFGLGLEWSTTTRRPNRVLPRVSLRYDTSIVGHFLRDDRHGALRLSNGLDLGTLLDLLVGLLLHTSHCGDFVLPLSRSRNNNARTPALQKALPLSKKEGGTRSGT